MATRGRPIPASDVRAIRRLAVVASVRQTARVVGVAPNTVQKYKKRTA